MSQVKRDLVFSNPMSVANFKAIRGIKNISIEKAATTNGHCFVGITTTGEVIQGGVASAYDPKVGIRSLSNATISETMDSTGRKGLMLHGYGEPREVVETI